MTIILRMPGGGDEHISPGSILVLRELTDLESAREPQAKSQVWGGGARIYPDETVEEILEKMDGAQLAPLHAPAGLAIYVNVAVVSDVDDPNPVFHHQDAGSVLRFGVGHSAPNIPVRETRNELTAIWESYGGDTSIL